MLQRRQSYDQGNQRMTIACVPHGLRHIRKQAPPMKRPCKGVDVIHSLLSIFTDVFTTVASRAACPMNAVIPHRILRDLDLRGSLASRLLRRLVLLDLPGPVS